MVIITMRYSSDLSVLGRIKQERNANFILDRLNMEMSSIYFWGENYSLLFDIAASITLCYFKNQMVCSSEKLLSS